MRKSYRKWAGKSGSRPLLFFKKHLYEVKGVLGKMPPTKFFREFFLIPNFYFYENFRLKMKNEKSTFIQFIFLIINNNLFILYFSIFFPVRFDLQAWYTMFIIHICVTNNAGHRYLASEANCRKTFLKLRVSHNTSIQI